MSLKQLKCFVFLISACLSNSYLSSYVVNWAQYRAAPYTWVPSNLQPAVAMLDLAVYGFVYFCPPAGTSPMPYWALPPYGECSDATAYQAMFVEQKDPQFIQELIAMKADSPDLKVALSVGGWNFPSHYWSKMVESATSRATFIQSMQALLQKTGADGIDLDWEYPCSPARNNPVKISCGQFRTVVDEGGSCPADTTNLAALVKELREAFGNEKLITMASQAALEKEQESGVAAVAPYIDHFHLMNYDYTVSDVQDSSITCPNGPLYNPPAASGCPQQSINYTVNNYLSVGVPANKLVVGFPLYAHTWYVPTANNWKQFGLKAQIQGKCCGPFQNTYGGLPGKGCSECGTYMISEIIAAGPDTWFDPVTQSAVAYMSKPSGDGYTTQGVWFSYNDQNSAQALGKFATEHKLKGGFVFDTSQDTVNFATGQFTYQLTTEFYKALGGGSGSGHICDPSIGCNVCTACCKSYIKPQSTCDACYSDACHSSN